VPAEQAPPAAPVGRKHLRRLERVFEDLPGPLFYLTCCVDKRAPLLASKEVATVLVSAWKMSRELYGWEVGRYVVMPDHVHFFAAPRDEDAQSIGAFVGRWKSWTTRAIKESGVTGFAWQSEFFDHVLRSSESYAQKWEYVRANPVRAGLVEELEEWPFAGEVSVLSW
jgi:REP element-mobilizing transposase RayT